MRRVFTAVLVVVPLLVALIVVPTHGQTIPPPPGLTLTDTPTISPLSTSTPPTVATDTPTAIQTSEPTTGTPSTAVASATIPPPPPPPGTPTAIVAPSATARATQPEPTATASALTPLSTATGILTATATLVPPPRLKLTIRASAPVIGPGHKETISGHTHAGASVLLRLTYPNGDAHSAKLSVHADGSFSWTFVVPRSEITHTRFMATVAATARRHGATVERSLGFRLQFGPIDVSAQPRTVKPGWTISLWVHTAPRSRIYVYLLYPDHSYGKREARTGPGGWDDVRVKIPSGKTQGGRSVSVVAQVNPGPHLQSAETTFTIM